MAKRDADERVIHSGRQFESMVFPRAARERRAEADSTPRVAGARRAAEELQQVKLVPVARRSKTGK